VSGDASLPGRLRELRKRAGLDVARLAELASVAPASILSWESGSADISAAELDAVTRAVGLRVRDLERPADEWPLDPGLFRAEGPTAPRVVPAAYATICDFKRCVADVFDLERLLGHSASPTLGWHEPFDPVPPYRATELASKARAELGLSGADPIPSMTRILEARLDTRVFAVTPDELPASVHAMSTALPRPAVLVNLLDSNPRVRYALAHELCHLLFDLDARRDVVTAEAGAYDEIERRADAFAANFLAPTAGVRAIVKGEPSTEDNVREVAKHFCIGRHHAINRICDAFGLPFGTSAQMASRPRSSWTLDFEEELPPPGLRSGVLLKHSLRALSRGLIDRVRAREILHVRNTEWLPRTVGGIELPEDLARPLRDPAANVRGAVAQWIARRYESAETSDPQPTSDGWEVEVRAGPERLRLTVNRAFEVERAA